MTASISKLNSANAGIAAQPINRQGIQKLQPNLLGHIFSFLPGSEVVKGKQVCKGFSPGIRLWQRMKHHVETQLFGRYISAMKNIQTSPHSVGGEALQEIRKLAGNLTKLEISEQFRMTDLLAVFAMPQAAGGSGEEDPLFPKMEEVHISLRNFYDTEPQRVFRNGRKTREFAPPLVDAELVLKTLERVGFHCPQMRKLCLTDAGKEPALALLGNCSQVQSLRLDDTKINYALLPQMFPKLKELAVLSSGINHHLSLESLKDCSTMSQLREIDIRDTSEYMHQDSSLQVFEGHLGLQTIRLEACSQITNESLGLLARIPQLSSLRISNCSKINSLGALKGARSLANLYLQASWGVKIGDLLRTCPPLETVRSLTLDDARGLSAENLELLGKCKELRYLEIYCQTERNKITDRDLAHLASCRELLSLKITIPQGWTITNEGIARLAAALPCLQELEIFDCNEKLDLSGLAKESPHLHVKWNKPS